MSLHEEMSMSVLEFNQLLLQKPTSRWNAVVPFHVRGCWKIQEKKKTNERGMEESSSLFTLWYVAISIQYHKLPAGNFHLNSIKQHTTIKVSSGFLQVHDSVFKFHELVCLSSSAWARSLTSSQCSPSSENNAVWRGITVHECEGRTWPYGRWSQVLWSHELALTTPSKILVADCLYSCWYMPISQQLLFLMLCTEGIPLWYFLSH